MKIDYRETTLPNGVRVASSTMPHVGSVTMGFWVGVGSRYENKKLSGLSHFLEHLLFKGTRKRSAREISEAIEGRGGYFNAFTQEESTCYYARVADEHTWKVFDVLADMYLHSKLAVEDIDKERGVIVEEIMMYRDRPSYVADDHLMELLWKNHPLGRSILGPPENIRSVPVADIRGFKQSRYVPGNLVIVFAGNVDHQECVDKVGKYFGRLKKRRQPTFKKCSTQVKQGAQAVVPRPSEQVHLAMGLRIFGRNNPRRYPLKLLSVILGENMSSRLFQVVREKHGLAYSVNSGSQMFDDTGAFEISAGLDRNRFNKAFSLICKELARIKNRPVSTAELERARDYSVGQLRINLESTTNQMIWIGENLVSYGAYREPDVVIDRLKKVSREDIASVARQIIKPSRLSVAAVIPEEMKGVEDAIKAGVEKL